MRLPTRTESQPKAVGAGRGPSDDVGVNTDGLDAERFEEEPEVTDEEFVAHVRQYKRRSLLSRLAADASRHTSSKEWLARGKAGLYAPWALAEVARVSLAYGNEHGRPTTAETVAECSMLFAGLGDADLAAQVEGAVQRFFLRLTLEQLDYQRPLLHEMARSAALLTQTPPAKTMSVIQGDWECSLFGGTLSEFAGAGQLMFYGCRPNAGRFNPTWLSQPNFDPICEILDADLMRHLFATNFTTTRYEFRVANGRPEPSENRRYTYNPLMATPVITDAGNDWLIPVPALLARRMTTSGIYYAGMRKWGSAFSTDLGDLFQQYVGRNLGLLPDGVVLAEFKPGHDNVDSIDWFVVLPEVVLLVEVKSTRPTEAVRRGTLDASDAMKQLRKGYEQIVRDDALIAEDQPDFAHLPRDRPRVGLIVTMEDFHVVNSGFHKPMWQPNVVGDLPVLVTSIGELEHLVTVSDTTPGRLLLDHLSAPELNGHSVKSALVGHAHRRNPVIDAGWSSYPWHRLKDVDSDRPAETAPGH